MTSSDRIENGNIIFYCTRQDPDDFETIVPELFQCKRMVRIEMPCSGRAGSGEIMQSLAAGYDKVIVLGCGAESCIHGFGCSEAVKAMDLARKLSHVAGVDGSKVVFLEADQFDLKDKESHQGD